MKKQLLGLCFLLVLSGIGSVPGASAHDWWPHRHHKDASPKTHASKPPKTKKSFLHRERAKSNNETVASVSPGPRSVGGRHPQPGPAGAGAY